MKNRIRKLLAAATIVSTLLFVTTIVFWIRSFWFHDLRISKFDFVQDSAESVRGSLRFCRVSSGYRHPPEDVGVGWYCQPVFSTDSLEQRYHSRSGQWLILGLGMIEGDFREGAIYPGEPAMPYRVVVVPYWLVALVFAAMPLVWIIRRRKRRVRAGCCERCGYDLRATPLRCPECGAPAKPFCA